MPGLQSLQPSLQDSFLINSEVSDFTDKDDEDLWDDTDFEDEE